MTFISLNKYNLKYLFSTILICGICNLAFAQIEEEYVEEYYQGYPFVEGIYQTFNEFKNNNPIIQTVIEIRQANLYVLSDTSEEMLLVDPNRVWGYSKDGNIYVSFEDGYWRILNMGSLAHFTAIRIFTYQTFDSFGFPVNQSSKRLEHLFLDTETGEIKALSSKNLKPYVDKEPILASQSKKLKNKTESLIVILNAYNKLNPLYFTSSYDTE